MDGPAENYEGEENYEEQETYEENYEGPEGENGNFEEGEEGEEEEEEEVEEEVEEEEEEEDPNNNGIEEEEMDQEPEQENNGENNNLEEEIGIGGNGNSENNNNLGEINEESKWKGWPGENAFRILVPGHKVGAVIGHKGDIIKKMAEETKARIRILNSPPGIQERVVLITSKEEPDLQISPAMEGLFRVHKRIVDGLEPDSEQPPSGAGTVPPTRLLVPGVQAAMIIGKQGATIKLIQESSGAVVRVSENVPPIALYDDRIVEIQGEPSSMHKALELISTYLRKFLIDRSIIPLFEAQMQQNLQNNQQMEPMPGQHQHWGPPPPQNYSAPPPYPAPPAGPGYGASSYAAPPPPDSNYYPPPSDPYSKPPSYPTPAGNQSGGSQITQHMQVPLSYVDAVIGADGASISYIRRASGATVTVQETRGVPGEMTVEMVGSHAQVQTAQQLIQNFMAEAAPPGVGAPAAAPAAAPAEPGYGSYSSYGSGYGTGPPGTGPADPAAPYGSGYPAGYGY